MNRPPLGVKPKWIYDEKINNDRMLDLLHAMKRYVEENKDIPWEWLVELDNRNREQSLIHKKHKPEVQVTLDGSAIANAVDD